MAKGTGCFHTLTLPDAIARESLLDHFGQSGRRQLARFRGKLFMAKLSSMTCGKELSWKPSWVTSSISSPDLRTVFFLRWFLGSLRNSILRDELGHLRNIFLKVWHAYVVVRSTIFLFCSPPHRRMAEVRSEEQDSPGQSPSSQAQTGAVLTRRLALFVTFLTASCWSCAL